MLGKDAKSIEELLQESANEEEQTEETEEEKEEDTKAKKSAKIHVQRYKGLGEMNAEELWETTMDPERRILKQVAITDAEEANKIFDMLMGSEVPPRKAFIQSNAKMAKLDI
jgi:DNA gyrase subunit B